MLSSLTRNFYPIQFMVNKIYIKLKFKIVYAVPDLIRFNDLFLKIFNIQGLIDKPIG